MEWVNSAGGPLICAEQKVARTWKGVLGLSLSAPGVTNDYQLTCHRSHFRIAPSTYHVTTERI